MNWYVCGLHCGLSFSDTIPNTLNVCARAYDVPVLITFFVTSPNGQIVSHPNTRWFLPSLDTTGLNPIYHTIVPAHSDTHSCTPPLLYLVAFSGDFTPQRRLRRKVVTHLFHAVGFHIQHAQMCEDTAPSHRVCEKREWVVAGVNFHVGGFASGLQCTLPSPPAAVALLQPYLAFALPVVALTVLEIVWEVSGDNVCDLRAHPKPAAW